MAAAPQERSLSHGRVDVGECLVLQYRVSEHDLIDPASETGGSIKSRESSSHLSWQRCNTCGD